jgi:hypothetical protein
MGVQGRDDSGWSGGIPVATTPVGGALRTDLKAAQIRAANPGEGAAI